jgi:hypothetical protein
MNRRILFAYQLLTGASDTATGALLILAPELTLGLMRLHVPADALPFVSFIGAFVFSVGLACLYGAYLVWCSAEKSKLEMVWLLTAFTRSAVAIFVLQQIMVGALEAGWLTVAISDGTFVVIQAVGLRRGWLANAAR